MKNNLLFILILFINSQIFCSKQVVRTKRANVTVSANKRAVAINAALLTRSSKGVTRVVRKVVPKPVRKAGDAVVKPVKKFFKKLGF